MNTLAIDPGSEKSGVVLYCSSYNVVLDKGIVPNADVAGFASELSEPIEAVVFEMIGHYGTGMPAGKTVFDTCIWIGRMFEKLSLLVEPENIRYILRPTVKTHICGSPKAKDANVRQALLDRFEPLGGGKTPEVGTKALQGPLFGFKSHLWSSLAVAIAGSELWETLERFPQ